MNAHRGNVLQILCSGEPRDMGRQQGTALRTGIRALRGDLAQLESFRLRQPAWLSYVIYRWLADLAVLTADHGPDGQPSMFTPCVHSDFWNTTACMQMLPRSRRLRIAFDRACRAQYEEFAL